MSTPSSVPADIGKITEPLLLGHLLQWTLFGALSVQVYNYYLAFPNDALQRKLLAYTVYIAELVQAIILAKLAYTEFAAGFGNFEAINTIGLSVAVPILSAIVAATVQIFYAYRIKILADSYLIPSVVVLCALVQLGGGITLGVFGFQFSLFSRIMVAKKTLIVSGISNGSSALCDVIIASSMTYYLSRHKSTSKQTQRMVRRLIRMNIETGTLTAVIAIINLVMFQIPGVTYYQATYAVLGKMYSNTMMMNLNSRMVSRYSTTDTNDTVDC